MTKISQVKIVDNSGLFRNALPIQVEKALVSVGQTAEGYAKGYLRASGAIDTSRLINSVTFAIAGKPANITSYNSNSTHKDGKPVKVTNFEYSGNAPKTKDASVYVGTNVEYGIYVETGTSKMNPRPFIKPAATEHTDEYKELVKEALTNG